MFETGSLPDGVFVNITLWLDVAIHFLTDSSKCPHGFLHRILPSADVGAVGLPCSDMRSSADQWLHVTTPQSESNLQVKTRRGAGNVPLVEACCCDVSDVSDGTVSDQPVSPPSAVEAFRTSPFCIP